MNLTWCKRKKLKINVLTKRAETTLFPVKQHQVVLFVSFLCVFIFAWRAVIRQKKLARPVSLYSPDRTRFNFRASKS